MNPHAARLAVELARADGLVGELAGLLDRYAAAFAGRGDADDVRAMRSLNAVLTELVDAVSPERWPDPNDPRM